MLVVMMNCLNLHFEANFTNIDGIELRVINFTAMQKISPPWRG